MTELIVIYLGLVVLRDLFTGPSPHDTPEEQERRAW